MGFLDPGPEVIILIFVIIILLFGASKIPELARGLGRAIGEFKRGKIEIEREIKMAEINEEKELSGETPVLRAAKELGINTSDKTEDELRKAIAANLVEKEPGTAAVNVAK